MEVAPLSVFISLLMESKILARRLTIVARKLSLLHRMAIEWF